MNDNKFVYSSVNDFKIMITQCQRCIHKFKNKHGCKAFDKIPINILSGKFDHTKKHPEQENDILFEPIEK